MFQGCLSKGSISQDIFSLQFFNISLFTESTCNKRYNATQVLKI